MCVNDSPMTTGQAKLEELRHFDSWSPARQARTLGWYRACLLKKLHREPASEPGTPRWIVSKNPAFSQKIPYLAKVFPGARFILLVRNPMEAIPSRLNLIEEIWKQRFPGTGGMTSGQARTIVEDSLRTYLFAERDLPCVPEGQRLVVRYDDFVRDIQGTVTSLYSGFGLPGPSEAMCRVLEDAAARQKDRGPGESHSLGSFGIDEAEVRQRLAPLMDRYGFQGAGE
jgi:hypothetical protein